MSSLRPATSRIVIDNSQLSLILQIIDDYFNSRYLYNISLTLPSEGKRVITLHFHSYVWQIVFLDRMNSLKKTYNLNIYDYVY